MADTTVAASLTLDTQQANVSVKEFRKQLDEAKKDLKEIVQKFGETSPEADKARKKVDQLSESVKSFATRIKEAEQNLILIQEKFGATSKEAIAAAKHVADLKDQFKEAKEVADLFDPGAKFQAFGNVVRTVTGGFSALTGTMALFGAESEETEKALLKVQAALAITEGVNTIADATKDFERLGAIIQQTTIFQKANAAATKAAAVVQKLFAGAVDTTTTSFKVLKGAIVATGIGALIVVIGLVIEKINSMTSADEDAADAKERLAKETERLNKALQDQISFTDKYTKENIASAKARGAGEEELLKIERKNFEDRIFLAQTALDDARRKGIETFEFEKKLSDERQLLRIFDFEQQIKFREKAEQEAKKAADKAKQEADKRRAEIMAQLEREKSADDELRKLRQENFLSEIEDEDERARQRIFIDTDNEEKRIESLKISENKKLDLLIEIRVKQQDALDELDKKIAERDEEKRKEAEKKNQENLEEELDRLFEEFEAVQEVRKELDAMQRDDLSQQLFELDEWYKQRFEIIQGNEELERQLLESFERQKTELMRSAAEQRLSIVAGILGKAADLLGKQTAAGKTLAIAEATINTYTGATAALRSKVPFPEPVATAIRVAQAALIVATGLKNIREIAKAKVPGGGGSVPSLSNTAAPLTPQPQVGTTTLDQDTLNSIGNATVRAYVVSEDVENDRERITRLNRAARLGG